MKTTKIEAAMDYRRKIIAKIQELGNDAEKTGAERILYEFAWMAYPGVQGFLKVWKLAVPKQPEGCSPCTWQGEYQIKIGGLETYWEPEILSVNRAGVFSMMIIQWCK